MAPRQRRAALLLLVVAGAAVWAAASLSATNQHGVTVVRFSVYSRLLHRSLPATAAIPPGTRGPRPLVVFLHGKGPDGQDSNLSQQLFAALARLGPRAPVIVFPNGSEDSYWHNRATGAWGDYVVKEVVPQATSRFGTDPRRVAIGGISMGGFGALDLARLHPNSFCAVGAHSAALWTQGGETAPGAFDDAEDFGRHDVIAAARPASYQGVPVWIDVGTNDPFRAADTLLARRLHGHRPQVAFYVWPGGHDGAYWRRHWTAYLAFYATACAPAAAAQH